MKGTEKLIIDGLKLAEELNYFEKIPKFYLELSNIKNANKQYREAVNLSLLGLKNLLLPKAFCMVNCSSS